MNMQDDKTHHLGTVNWSIGASFGVAVYFVSIRCDSIERETMTLLRHATEKSPLGPVRCRLANFIFPCRYEA